MKSLPSVAYGLLLTIDGYGASYELCADAGGLYRLLEKLPALIGMRPLGLPHVVSVEETGIAGLSGFTFIMESHISIHTYQERGFVTADVYSCKNFDTEIAADYIARYFKIASFETNVLTRGKKFHLQTSSVLVVS
jgi:S-adenosylmethionine decarboxylase